MKLFQDKTDDHQKLELPFRPKQAGDQVLNDHAGLQQAMTDLALERGGRPDSARMKDLIKDKVIETDGAVAKSNGHLPPVASSMSHATIEGHEPQQHLYLDRGVESSLTAGAEDIQDAPSKLENILT